MYEKCVWSYSSYQVLRKNIPDVGFERLCISYYLFIIVFIIVSYCIVSGRGKRSN